MTDVNFKAGEFVVESFTLVNQYGDSVDLRGLVLNFRLYENIYQNFLTGDITILDGLDIIKNYRMTGQENIRISIKSKEGFGYVTDKEFTIDKTFRVYKIINVSRNGAGIQTQTYQIKICDPRLFYARKQRISQVFRGSWSAILQNALINKAKFKIDEFDHFEDSLRDNYQFVCPNWNVQQLINYCTNNAQSTQSESFKRSMFFYQTLNGGFRFKSIERMFQDEFPLSFSFTPRNNLDTQEVPLDSASGLNTQILSVVRSQVFDTLQGLSGGAYSSSMSVYEPYTKEETARQFDLTEVFARQQDHASGYPMINVDEDEIWHTAGNLVSANHSPDISQVDVDFALNKSFLSSKIYDYHIEHNFDNRQLDQEQQFRGRDNDDNSRLRRRALLETLQQNRITVQIPLRTDLSVGQMIKLILPPAESSGNKQIVDNLNDHRYLITDIMLEASPGEGVGVLNLECVKESFADRVKDIRPLAEVTSGSPHMDD